MWEHEIEIVSIACDICSIYNPNEEKHASRSGKLVQQHHIITYQPSLAMNLHSCMYYYQSPPPSDPYNLHV